MGRKDCSDRLEQNFQLNLGKITDYLPQTIKAFSIRNTISKKPAKFSSLKAYWPRVTGKSEIV